MRAFYITPELSKFLSGIVSIVLTTALILIIWLCFSPGFISPDSIVQYKEALNHQYTNTHPPVMAYLWHMAIALIDGPEALFFVHLTVLAVAIIIWIDNTNSWLGSVLIPLVFFCPWIINFAGVLWKDVGLAFSLLLATGLLFHKRTGWLMISAAIPFLFYASAVRHNAIFAVAPIIYFATIYHFPALSKWKAVCSVVLSLVALILASSVINNYVINAEEKHFETYLMGDDIAMISASTGKDLLPGLKREDAVACSIHPILYERALCFISKGYDPGGSLVVKMDPGIVHSLWLNTITDSPLIYLKLKFNAFMYLLRSPDLAPYYVWHPGTSINEFKIELKNPDFAKKLEQYVTASQELLDEMFKPYLWLILCIIILAVSISGKVLNREKIIILALNFSAAGYFLSYLVSALSADFRYIYWCILAISVSMVCYLINVIPRKNLAHTNS